MDEFGSVIRRATQAVSTLKVRLSMGMAVMQLVWLLTALSQDCCLCRSTRRRRSRKQLLSLLSLPGPRMRSVSLVGRLAAAVVL